MRLLYCVGSLDKPGGTEKVLANKCNYFVNHYGYEIHIITINQANKSYCYEWDEKIKFHDIEYVPYSNKIVNLLRVPSKIKKFRIKYSKLIEEINPDIIIVTERGYLDYVIPFICKSIPKVREFHSSRKAIKIHASQMSHFKRVQHMLMYSIIYKMFSLYDYLILLTQSDANESRYNTKVRVIPNMVEYVEIESASLKKKHAISVGSMNGKIKGFDDQIIMWKSIVRKHPDWVLDIYGDGGRRPILQNLINKLGLEGKVILHGNTSKIYEKYSESSFFLFTSVGEGFPMVLIEAMNTGLPIISYKCPHGPSDIITDGEDGFLLAPGDTDGFIDKILLLIEDSDLRTKMGINAKTNMTRFRPSKIALIWESLFKQILK